MPRITGHFILSKKAIITPHQSPIGDRWGVGCQYNR